MAINKDYGKIRRGFKPLLTHMEKNGKYFANCNSCAHFYSPKLDEPEQCNNLGVTHFDMCTREDGSEYCCYWKSVGMEKKARERNE